MIMKKIIIIISAFILFLCFNSFAQDTIIEEDLFSSPGSIFDIEEIVDKNKIEEEEKSIGISGKAESVIELTGTRDWIKGINKDDPNAQDNTLSSYILGNLFLDIRLKKGVKCFANMETMHDSNAEDADFFLREFFIDFNTKHSVYLRTGKQVLQWGRCYLWNPSDLINVEKKMFKEKIGSREGAYGIKIHVPFGTKYNIYGFLDTGKVTTADEIGTAFKFEFVLGKTEMAFSVWGKKGYRSVYAYDFSTRIFGIDTFGEAAFSYGDNYETLRLENGYLIKYKEKNKWIPRVCIDLGKSFEFMNIKDRISLNLEFYYNHTGLTDNIFNDDTEYNFGDPVYIADPNGNPIERGTKRDFLFYNNMYEENNLSKYYMAIFTNFDKFIISDMKLVLNLIGNLNDKSYILTSGIEYRNINDFSIGLNIYSYIGRSNREYTFHNNAVTAQLTIGIEF